MIPAIRQAKVYFAVLLCEAESFHRNVQLRNANHLNVRDRTVVAEEADKKRRHRSFPKIKAIEKA